MVVDIVQGALVIAALLGATYGLGWLERKIFKYPVVEDNYWARGLIVWFVIVLTFVLLVLFYQIGSLI